MQNCVLRMLAFRQISSFIWRSNLMSKKEASQRRFCEWGLNSYNNVYNVLSEKKRLFKCIRQMRKDMKK